MTFESRFAANTYTAQFELKLDVPTIWHRLQEVDVERAQPQWLRAFPCAPGFDVVGEIQAQHPERRITARKTSEPCEGTDIELELEPADPGCRVTLRQTNFPDWAAQQPDLLLIGGDQIAADIALFLEHGVMAERHNMAWAFPGALSHRAPGGLMVDLVVPSSWAERLGLQTGDILVTCGGCPVTEQHDLQTLMRLFAVGDEVAATWVRDRQLQQSVAIL